MRRLVERSMGLPYEDNGDQRRQRNGQLEVPPVSYEVGQSGQGHPGASPEKLQGCAGEGPLPCREELTRHYDTSQARALEECGH